MWLQDKLHREMETDDKIAEYWKRYGEITLDMVEVNREEGFFLGFRIGAMLMTEVFSMEDERDGED